MVVIFFFSSRRRHTRWTGDWSSDVCSSDLDGFFATFDGPARAIHCACAIRDHLDEIGLEVRSGLHTGECERVGEKVAGIAVHIGARVAAVARPGEVLVSRTVKNLVAGSGIELDDRGGHELKGIPGDWQLFAVKAT